MIQQKRQNGKPAMPPQFSSNEPSANCGMTAGTAVVSARTLLDQH